MKKKIVFIFFIQLSLFIVVIAKAFKIQVVDRDRLIKYSHKQFLRTKKEYPKRGNILDRNGNPLAINIQTYNIVALPKETENLKKSLAQAYKISPSFKLKKKYKESKKRNKYTRLSKKVSLTNDKLEKLKKIKGIFLEPHIKRVYPNKELLSQTLGFVGQDNDGLAGVEYQFNKQLRGQAIIRQYYRDAKGRPIKFKTVEFEDKASDIHLSIDKNIQAVAEKYLKEAVLHHEATRGGVAVMDAYTGEIWAIANYPTFNPNHFSKSKPLNRKLSFVTDSIEPGSTFKTLTIASALENNIVRPETSYFCENGKLRVQDHIITEAESKKDLEWLSVSDILKYSSNIGTAKIAFDLNYKRLKSTLKKFRIGQKTGIEFPGEAKGIVVKDKNVSPLKLSNVSFGQGIATTGIQMLASYAAIANGGYYVRPTLLKVKNDDQINKDKILSSKTSEELTKMLVSVVDSGTGSNTKVPHFVIAGKTSTAQKVSENGGYKGYVSGFIGFPVNVKNRFVVSVYIDDPQENGYYGNLTSGPAFQKLTKYILYRKKEFSNVVSKRKILKKSKNKIDSIRSKLASISRSKIKKNFLSLDKLSARAQAEKLDVKVKFIGHGVVKKEVKTSKNSYTLYLEPPKYE